MSNAVTKALFIIGLPLISYISTSCSDDNVKRAENLLSSAEESLANHDFNHTLSLLDSIDHAYPKVIDVRKKAMSIRPKAMEGAIINKIAETDSMLAINLIAGDSLSRNLIKIDNPIEPYFISQADANIKSQYNVEGLHGRVAPDGMFYIIASASGSAPFTTIAVETGGLTAETSAVNPDGERNRMLDKNRVITYIAGECDSVGRILSDYNTPATVILKNGDKEIKRFTLSESQREGISDTYLTAQAFMKCHLLRIEKAKLEKQLSLSRQQIADTYSTKD
ncbi:MAG: hypothetical protein K2M94_00415 [Paramuribaculum sp.]|nr:hypothetical protein [Paramuribaculum sp.]